MNDLEEFQEKLLKRTDLIIENEFGAQSDLDAGCYHYTNLDTAEKIINSKTIFASLIRSTSDPLEYALPIASCRDWLCFENILIQFPIFPQAMFKHFNEEAIDPTVRPYFISLSTHAKSEYLEEFYGNGIVKFDFSKANLSGKAVVLKCKYVSDVRAETFRILTLWCEKAFKPLTGETHEDIVKDPSSWFYIFMLLCNSIALAVKQRPFSQESEVRLIFHSKDLSAPCEWHGLRNARTNLPKSLLVREYLPVNLETLGISINHP